MDGLRFLVPIFGTLIPIMAIAAGMFSRWAKMKERQMEVQTSMTAEMSAQYAAQTERLEARVRVLERILTDRGVDLSDEIEALRDRPLN